MACLWREWHSWNISYESISELLELAATAHIAVGVGWEDYLFRVTILVPWAVNSSLLICPDIRINFYRSKLLSSIRQWKWWKRSEIRHQCSPSSSPDIRTMGRKWKTLLIKQFKDKLLNQSEESLKENYERDIRMRRVTEDCSSNSSEDSIGFGIDSNVILSFMRSNDLMFQILFALKANIDIIAFVC